MRHRKSGTKLGRTPSHRKALLANMAAALIKHEQIVTSLPKARMLRPFVERLITLARRGDLHARRQAAAKMPEKEGVSRLFSVLGVRYKERPGGYTRILKAGFQRGDNSPVAVIELVERDESRRGVDSGPPPPKKGEDDGAP